MIACRIDIFEFANYMTEINSPAGFPLECPKYQALCIVFWFYNKHVGSGAITSSPELVSTVNLIS